MIADSAPASWESPAEAAQMESPAEAAQMESPAEAGLVLPVAGTPLFDQGHCAAEERHTQVTAVTSSTDRTKEQLLSDFSRHSLYTYRAYTASHAPWPISRL